MSSATGQCLCGDVKFSVQLPVKWCAHCHCSLCQRAHGAAIVTWVGVAEGQYHIDAKDLRWFASSEQGERAHCGCCGTPLFFRSTRWPGELHISRACIDSDQLTLPQAHVYCRSAASWLSCHDQLPRFTTVPGEQNAAAPQQG